MIVIVTSLFRIMFVSYYHMGVGVRIAFVLTRRGNAKTWRSGMKQCIKPTLFIYISKLIADNLKINNKVDINKDENIKKIINGGKLTKNAFFYIF